MQFHVTRVRDYVLFSTLKMPAKPCFEIL